MLRLKEIDWNVSIFSRYTFTIYAFVHTMYSLRTFFIFVAIILYTLYRLGTNFNYKYKETENLTGKNLTYLSSSSHPTFFS